MNNLTSPSSRSPSSINPTTGWNVSHTKLQTENHDLSKELRELHRQVHEMSLRLRNLTVQLDDIKPKP